VSIFDVCPYLKDRTLFPLRAGENGRYPEQIIDLTADTVL
jgi:hypothetical protein